jgi:hypothetical protein
VVKVRRTRYLSRGDASGSSFKNLVDYAWAEAELQVHMGHFSVYVFVNVFSHNLDCVCTLIKLVVAIVIVSIRIHFLHDERQTAFIKH